MPTQQNMIFTVEGVHVSSDHMCNEKLCTIHLDNLSNDSSGAYRCEVSGDAPEFKLVHETSNMTIAGKSVFWYSKLLGTFSWRVCVLLLSSHHKGNRLRLIVSSEILFQHSVMNNELSVLCSQKQVQLNDFKNISTPKGESSIKKEEKHVIKINYLH